MLTTIGCGEFIEEVFSLMPILCSCMCVWPVKADTTLKYKKNLECGEFMYKTLMTKNKLI